MQISQRDDITCVAHRHNVTLLASVSVSDYEIRQTEQSAS